MLRKIFLLGGDQTAVADPPRSVASA
jgi:hypothetical protein